MDDTLLLKITHGIQVAKEDFKPPFLHVRMKVQKTALAVSRTYCVPFWQMLTWKALTKLPQIEEKRIPRSASNVTSPSFVFLPFHLF